METSPMTGSNPAPVGTDVWETVWVRVTCAVAIFDGKLASTSSMGTRALIPVSHVS